jgi:hypothetical protein
MVIGGGQVPLDHLVQVHLLFRVGVTVGVGDALVEAPHEELRELDFDSSAVAQLHGWLLSRPQHT